MGEKRAVIRAAAVSFLYGNDWSQADLTALADALEIKNKDRPEWARNPKKKKKHSLSA